MGARAWREPAVLRLMTKHRSKDPESLVARYAADLLHEWHLSELPIHVDALASALGIRVATPVFDGATEEQLRDSIMGVGEAFFYLENVDDSASG